MFFNLSKIGINFKNGIITVPNAVWNAYLKKINLHIII